MKLQIPPTALIVLAVLVAVVKRPSPSREASGAIALTVAAVILLSGVWSMWLSPTYDVKKNELMPMWIFRGEIISGGPFGLGPHSFVTYHFDVEQGQWIQIRMSPAGYIKGVRTTGGELVTGAGVSVYDMSVYASNRSLIFTITNVSKALIVEPLYVAESGIMAVEVSNPASNEVMLVLEVRDIDSITTRPLEPIGRLLMLISIPIFGLGVWFTRSKSRGDGSPH